MGKKYLILIVTIAAIFLSASFSFAENIVHTIDFTKQADGQALSWFEKNEWELKKNADDMKPRFENGAIHFDADEELGLFTKTIQLENVKKVRITWGVNKISSGANWEKGVYREPIMLVVNFGTKKITSGSFVVPNMPYFIGLFIGKKEKLGKAYIGNYYKKGGRYLCDPCNGEEGATVTTEFELDKNFQKFFNEVSTPAISGIAFEIDTRDTKGKSSAFIEKIEFIGE